jgi:hypothetical protein
MDAQKLARLSGQFERDARLDGVFVVLTLGLRGGLILGRLAGLASYGSEIVARTGGANRTADQPPARPTVLRTPPPPTATGNHRP